jgi:hypothetical protein
MTVLLTPPRPGTDLEQLLALEPDAEHVVVYQPNWLCARLRDRLSRTGEWELLTVAAFFAGDHAGRDWTREGRRDIPAAELAAWAGGLLRYPVTLEADAVELQIEQRFSRPHTEPIYWVIRNS